MYNRMKNFIEKHDMLNPLQYGFRKAHATHHAIIDIVEAIQTNMDQRLFTSGIFVHKLHHYGFRGIVNN